MYSVNRPSFISNYLYWGVFNRADARGRPLCWTCIWIEWKISKLLMVILSFWQIRLGCNERILKELNAYDNKCSQWRAQILQSKKIYILIPFDIIYLLLKKVFVMVSCNIFLFIRYTLFFWLTPLILRSELFLGSHQRSRPNHFLFINISLLYQFFLLDNKVVQ